MDNFLGFIGIDWITIVCAVFTFVIGYILKNKKMAKIVAAFTEYWNKAGDFLKEFEELLEAIKELHQEASTSTADGKLDPDEVQRLIEKGDRLIKEARDIKKLFAPPATE